jgi:UDP-glucose 4-epimerase
MSVLVTGGAGYIGSFVCRRLADAGLHVEILDNLTTGYLKNVEGMHFTEGNISDAKLVKSLCVDYNVDTVIHLAGVRHSIFEITQSDRIMFGERLPDNNLEDNYFDTIRLAMAAYDCGIDRFIFASTLDYDYAKRQSEDFLRSRFPNTVILRLAEVSGADGVFGDDRLHLNAGHGQLRFLPDMLNKLIYGGTIKIPSFPCDDQGLIYDYVHVLDVAEAFYKAWEYLDSGGGSLTCDIGSANPISARELLELVTDIYYPLLPGQVAETDPSLLFTARGGMANLVNARYNLGWRASFDIDGIITSTHAHEVRRGKAT